MLTSNQSRFSHSARLDRPGKGVARFGFGALLTIAAFTAQIASAQIAAGTTGIDATGSAQSEMTACTSGKTQQARETCIREVRNANAEKRAGKLSTSTDYSANAMKRCDVFKETDDQDACKARILGERNASGGVAGGGVLRESITIVPASSQ